LGFILPAGGTAGADLNQFHGLMGIAGDEPGQRNDAGFGDSADGRGTDPRLEFQLIQFVLTHPLDGKKRKRGSIFFGATDPDQGPTMAKRRQSLDQSGRRVMIFIVDDDSAVRDSLRLLLECAGLEARDFPSPETFLDGWKSADEDCLVLDVHMPGMCGLDLLEELRQRGDEVPVIVVTGRPSPADTARARAAGALAVLEKPFKPAEILGLVRQALREQPGPGALSAP
jgi:CheY-like chemotaxis protein